MRAGLRSSGIDLVGDVPWGTHFCQFYQTSQDLIDILVPYFLAGLRQNEFCMWVTSEPLKAEAARGALVQAWPDAEDCLRRGQIEILDYTEWYTGSGGFNAQRVLKGWVEKEAAALRAGYDGLRLTGNTFWLEKGDWQSFSDYEATINKVIGGHRMLALCSYSVEKCGAFEVIDVVSNHQFALIKQSGKWNLIESLHEKRMEEARKAYLERSEAELEAIFDGAPVPMFLVNRERCIRKANRAASRFAGSDDLLGKRPGEALHCIGRLNPRNCGFGESCERCTLREAVDDTFQTGHPRVEFEARMTLAVDGVARPSDLLLSTTPVSVNDERLVLVSVEDITARTEAQETLRRYQLLAENSRDVILFLRSEDGRILEANAAALQAYGYTHEELLARRVHDLRATDPAAVDGQLAAADSGGILFETVHRRKDGGTFPVEVSARGATIGGIRTVISVVRDITERKHAEAALRGSEEQVRRKLDSILSPEGDIGHLELADVIDVEAVQSLMDDLYRFARIPMAIIDLKGKVLVGVGWQDVCTKFHRVHPETCKHCIESDTQLSAGVAPGEFRLYKCKNNMWDIASPIIIAGQHVGNIFSGQFFFEGEPVDDEAFRRQAGKYGFDEQQYLAALHAVPRLTMQRVKAAMDFFVGLAQMLSRLSYSNIKLARSLAERDMLMESLSQAKAAAEIANTAKDRFLAVLSHELRTPLSPVLMTASALEMDDSLPEELRDDMGMIRRSVELEVRLINDLLDFNRVKWSKLQLKMQPLDAHEKLEAALEVCKGDATEKRLTVISELNANDARVDADGARLQQVFWNLLNNAIKFTRESGTITIRSSNPSTGRLRLEFADTGAGIEPEVLPHIFAAFVQASPHVTRQFGGLGLGLAISKSLIEMHGGTIVAQSEGAGKGTTFVIELPTCPAKQADTETPAAQAATSQRLKILLVEDDGTTARIMGRLLQKAGHEVKTAMSVSHALDAARSYPFDLLISDLGLPDGSGYQLMRELRMRRAGVLGIAVSGYGTDTDIQQSHQAGFAQHLTKPIDANALHGAIERLVAERV